MYKKTKSPRYPPNLVWIQDYLKEWNVLDNVHSIYKNESETAVVYIVKRTRFFDEIVTVNRVSKTNFHINYGSLHIRTVNGLQCAKEVKKLILQIKFGGN